MNQKMDAVKLIIEQSIKAFDPTTIRVNMMLCFRGPCGNTVHTVQGIDLENKTVNLSFPGSATVTKPWEILYDPLIASRIYQDAIFVSRTGV